MLLRDFKQSRRLVIEQPEMLCDDVTIEVI
jgi:hypothetical protein